MPAVGDCTAAGCASLRSKVGFHATPEQLREFMGRDRQRVTESDRESTTSRSSAGSMPPRTRSPLAHVLADLDAALRPGGHEWYLFEARAAQLRGLRRATVDVDVTIVSATLDASEILAPLRHAFTLRVADVDDFVRTMRVLPLVHDASSVPADAVLGGPIVDTANHMRPCEGCSYARGG